MSSWKIKTLKEKEAVSSCVVSSFKYLLFKIETVTGRFGGSDSYLCL